MTPWLSVIGIGDDGLAGLGAPARALIDAAEVVVGGARHLAMAPHAGAERLPWARSFTDTIAAIAARRGRRVVVLATGDPMWYGAGATLARHFPGEEMTVIPHPGAFSLAAARLGWPLADCVTLSLHGRPLDMLRLHPAEGRRLLLLSADGSTPAAVARLLNETGWGPSRLAVLEHLGGADAAMHCATAAEWGERRAADLNTIALECRAAPGTRGLSRLAGLPDTAFAHDGQLTKREIRAATLAALAPLPGERLWDVGAGCGSIAIEWLRADDHTAAIAIERDAGRVALIARNAAMLGVPRLEIVHGAAPQALAGIAPPDTVFAGGGLAEAALLPVLWQALRPGGRLVANVITTEGERALLDWQAAHGGTLTRLAVSRAEPLGAHRGWRALAPVTQLLCVKPG
ncbi:MAG TPA: precorrin-6y C5,15-methyltransferase (decarboxylating) subunit CbiE [Stellaceae bacterium]|nr:precorrin-6y C5,15-methyltransferase (decarboxylating) subunit CbiE [Stellaceae bacterium]